MGEQLLRNYTAATRPGWRQRLFDLLNLRFLPASAADAPHSTQPPPHGMIASCTRDRGWWEAWHAQQLGRGRDGPQPLKNLKIAVANKAFWNRSQTVIPESSAHATFMLRALCRGMFTVAIVGGSTSSGGGSASGCWPSKHPCGPKCCGSSYLAWLSEWFRLQHNVSMHMHNGAQGGTGPDFAYRCLESLVGGPQLGGQVDLVLIEFAINEVNNCLESGPRMELLLQRVHAWAPSAAVIFVNTFSVHNEIDASRCFVPLARHFGHASLSLQDAVKPLLQQGTLNVSTIFEEPIWHHPNVEGHRWLAAIVARFLDDAVHRVIQRSRGRAPPGRATLLQGSAVAAQKLGDATMATLGVDLGARAAWMTTTPFHPVRNASRVSGYPYCIRVPDLLNISARGWETSGSKGLTASATGSTLEIPFLCSRDGCGLTLALTQSYQPLGLLDAYVDDTLVGGKLSCAELAWVRAGQPQWTVQVFRQVVAVRTAGVATGGLSRGKHVLRIVARGETAPEVEALNLTSNYARHEVHFRGIIVDVDAE